MAETATPVILSGMPGDMAKRVLRELRNSGEFYPAMFMHSNGGYVAHLTGITNEDELIEARKKEDCRLIPPASQDVYLENLKKQHPNLLGINFANFNGYDVNLKFAKYGIPFICGTTGATPEQERASIEAVKESGICAIIDKNMSPALIVLGAMFKYAGDTFPKALEGYTGFGIDEHQRIKKDKTSGTLLTWQESFRKLGIDFDSAPGSRKGEYGHADHFMRVSSPTGDVRLNWLTEVLGRDDYALGTVRKGLPFLREKAQAGEKGVVYSMIDVLKG